jgi:deoxyadenosine/deoxycytidine kinase
MEHAYIDQLNRAYDDFFGHHVYPPILTIEVDDLDFVARAEDLQLVEARIRSALKVGAYQPPLPLEKEYAGD